MPAYQHKAFRIGFTIAVLISIALQYISYWRNDVCKACMDFGFRFGFPFPFYEYGGFVSYEEVLWLGLFGDIAFAIVVALWTGVLVNRVWGKLRPPD